MFQRGTGERFKYKAEVLKKWPTAFCKRVYVGGHNNGEKLIIYLYRVQAGEIIMSDAHRRAEDAWAEAHSNINKN